MGTLATKSVENRWLRDRLTALGVEVVLIDTGTRDVPGVRPDVSRAEVARAGGVDPAAPVNGNRGTVVAAMARGASEIVTRLFQTGRLHGVLSVGGGDSSVTATAMRALPVGVPKLLVSSMGAAESAPLGDPDDVQPNGLDRASAGVLANAAEAIATMATGYAARRAARDTRPVIGATMAGVTTPGVDAAREFLTFLGHEVLVFHAGGPGGRSFEAMAGGDALSGVLDVTLLELSTALLGGVGPAGPDRLESAGLSALPQVVSVGALDMAKFGRTVPSRLRRRRLHVPGPSVTMVRTTPGECAELGRTVAAKLSAATGPSALFLPLRGLSSLSTPDGPFHDPVADAALFDALREGLTDTEVEVHEVDTDINDPVFGRAMADRLHSMLYARRAWPRALARRHAP
jgi:uncharacterized protein (UPF0261 family)